MDTLSFFWVFVAFVGGGSIGVLAMALMCMAGGLPNPASAESEGALLVTAPGD